MAPDQTLPDGLLRISQIADHLGVSIATVRDWADSGSLQSFRTPGGQRRFWRQDVEAFLKDQEPAA